MPVSDAFYNNIPYNSHQRKEDIGVKSNMGHIRQHHLLQNSKVRHNLSETRDDVGPQTKQYIFRSKVTAKDQNDELIGNTHQSRQKKSSTSRDYYYNYRRKAGQEGRSISAYKTLLKIKNVEEIMGERVDDTENLSLATLKKHFVKEGWTEDAIDHLEYEMRRSLTYEMEGDNLSANRRWDEAMQMYQLALKIQASSCARKDDPDTAALWRKMAYTSVTQTCAWSTKPYENIQTPSKVHGALDSLARGNALYKECRYDRAVFEYRKATILGRLGQVQKSSRPSQESSSIPTFTPKPIKMGDDARRQDSTGLHLKHAKPSIFVRGLRR